jgi:S1-C subfamily serine protease
VTKRSCGGSQRYICIGFLGSLVAGLLSMGSPAWAGAPTPVVGAESSVVKITAVRGPDAVEEGSGFVIGQDRVLTNQHVVGTSSSVTAIFNSGVQQSCRVVGDSHARDLALLSCPSGMTPALHLANRPYQGEPVAAIGHPGGGPLRVSEGSVTNAVTDGAGYITINARLVPGNSGGPVIDRDTGAVVGIGSAFDPNAPGVDYAIPDQTLDAFLHNPPAPVPTAPGSDWSEWGWALADDDDTVEHVSGKRRSGGRSSRKKESRGGPR